MNSSDLDPDNRFASASKSDTGSNSPHNNELENKLKEDALQQADAGKHHVADEVDALADAIDAAASNLDDHDREGLARYAREMSGCLANAAGHLEERSANDLANDAKRLARDNPAMFMLGSIALGFGLSRFFKASESHPDKDETQSGEYSIAATSAATSHTGDGRTTL